MPGSMLIYKRVYIKLPEGNNPRINQGNPPVMQIFNRPGTKPGRFTMEATQ